MTLVQGNVPIAQLTAWLDQQATTPRTVPPIDGPGGPPAGTAAEFLRRTMLEAPGQVAVVAIGVDSARFAHYLDARVAGCL